MGGSNPETWGRNIDTLVSEFGAAKLDASSRILPKRSEWREPMSSPQSLWDLSRII